jgi:hypothetical protein
MVKRLRFQENRRPSRRRKAALPKGWVFEPLDMALAALIGAFALSLPMLMDLLK